MSGNTIKMLWFSGRVRLKVWASLLLVFLWVTVSVRQSIQWVALPVPLVDVSKQTDGASLTSKLSVQFEKASELSQKWTPRVVENQDDLLTVDNCPPPHVTQQQGLHITLATQLSADRFWLVEEACRRRWNVDPMVVVVYFESSQELDRLSANFIRRLEQAFCFHVHLIFYVDDRHKDEDNPKIYPINLLRNLALAQVRTSHVLMYDVDFLPSAHLEQHIRAAWQVRAGARTATQTNRTREALVVPALQMGSSDGTNVSDYTKLTVPSSFRELQICVNSGLCRIFDIVRGYGHSPTRTTLWLEKDWYLPIQCQADQPLVNDLRYVVCIPNRAYEPYVVLPWCSPGSGTRRTPYYDDRFVGYGLNKVQYILHLRYLGFLFWVMPEGFLIHVPHEITQWRESFMKDHTSMRGVFEMFSAELEERHPWQRTNHRNCQHWQKNFASRGFNESQAFCKAYV